MKSKRVTFFLAGSLALGLLAPASHGFAADEPTKAPVVDAAHADAKLDRASKIIPRVVHDSRGEDVGRVMDLIVDSRDGTVAYAIMRFGAWHGQTRFAIPFALLKPHANGKSFVWNTTKDKIDKNRGFSETAYPDMSETAWARELHQSYGVEPYWQEDNDSTRRRNRDRNRSPQISKDSPWTNRVNEIIGKPLVAADAQAKQSDLGKVKDLVIDLEHRHVVAFVIADGKDEKQIAWASVEPNAKQNRFALRAGGDTTAQAPTTTTPRTSPSNTAAANAADRYLQDTSLVRADTFIRDVVKDAKGNEIGRIMDLIIDTSGDAAYAIMRFGEWYGQTRFAIPFVALKESSDGKNFVLDITKDKLDRSRGFDKDKYPDMADSAWAREVHQRFGVTPYWERKIGDKPQEVRNPWMSKDHAWVNRFSEMLAKPVVTVGAENGVHENLGRLKDLVVDMKSGRVVYAVVALPDDSEKLTLVPWTALEHNPKENRFAIRTSKEVLAQNVFKENTWPKLTDAQWARGVHERFDKDPYWTVFGTPAPSATATDLDAAWRSDSSYNKLFRENDVRTVRGKVTRVDTFNVDRRVRGKGRLVTLKTDDGVTHTVHLGPVDFLDREGSTFKVSEGDELTITGSDAKFEDENVIIASRIRKGNETAQLRSRDGRPVWDRGDGEKDSNP